MVVATGFFDGVHLGHRFVLDTLVSAAASRGEGSMVATFWPHPRNVLQDDARSLRLLTSLAEKKELLTAAGVDRVEVIRFTREFSRMTAEQYMRDVLIAKYGATAIVLGYDNRMGCDGKGDDEAAAIARSLGLEVIRPACFSLSGDKVISSTRIRNLVSEGNVVEANAMLGYEYQILGVVVAGNRLGRTIGFPTANISLYEPLKLIPGNGVYLVKVTLDDRKFHGMCNVGVRPTVGKGNGVTIETNIFDFDEDIYGLDLKLEFVSKIRDERPFSDLNALAAQLRLDKEFCKSQIL